MFIVELSQDTNSFESVELYLQDVLQMAGHSVATLWERLNDY